MRFTLGTKLNMSQIFDENGVVHPVTLVAAGPIVVTQVKTKERDGYEAVQVGYGTRSVKRISKAVQGHTKNLGNFQFLKEFRGPVSVKVGDKIDLSLFKTGDFVTVSSTSKGKGFQGVVKRHGFAGGRRTHGQKHSEREPGAIGGGARAGGRVAKGMRMAGRMGSDRVTMRSVKVIQVDVANNVIALRGALPGRRGTIVEIHG